MMPTAAPLQGRVTIHWNDQQVPFVEAETDRDAAFALGLVLFFVTLALNYIAMRIVRKYREQYD